MARQGRHSQTPKAVVDRMVKRTVAIDWQDHHQRLAVADVLTGLTRLSGLAGTGRAAGFSTPAASAAINDVILAATKVTDLTGDRNYLLATINDLNRFAASMRIWQTTGSPIGSADGAPPPAARPKHRRADFVVTYFVKTGRDGQEVLVEKRDARKGFTVTRKDYDAAVAALAETRGPIKFNELHARFIAHGGSNVPSKYPLRVILRFCLSTPQGLVVKKSARTAAVGNILQQAAIAWRRIRQP